MGCREIEPSWTETPVSNPVITALETTPFFRPVFAVLPPAARVSLAGELGPGWAIHPRPGERRFYHRPAQPSADP